MIACFHCVPSSLSVNVCTGRLQHLQIGDVIKREFCLPSSVHIATKYRRLDKLALLDGALHFLDRDEVIMYAIFLARARFARGMGHAKMCKKLISFFFLMSLLSNLPEAERIGKLLEQLLQQCPLARA